MLLTADEFTTCHRWQRLNVIVSTALLTQSLETAYRGTGGPGLGTIKVLFSDMIYQYSMAFVFAGGEKMPDIFNAISVFLSEDWKSVVTPTK